jgi:starvation-inducible DNA-binding protein
MELQIGIAAKNLATAASLLNQFLAEEIVLYHQTRNAHWNVEGADFYAMHQFFEAQYEELDEAMDQVAERIRMIGYYAQLPAGIKFPVSERSEQNENDHKASTLIAQLLLGHEKLIRLLRENINCFAVELDDLGTSDFITGLMETHEKMAWMLRAHLD